MTAALAVSSRTGEARRKASGVGLLALKDQIAEMHGAPVAVQLNQNIKQSPARIDARFRCHLSPAASK